MKFIQWLVRRPYTGFIIIIALIGCVISLFSVSKRLLFPLSFESEEEIIAAISRFRYSGPLPEQRRSDFPLVIAIYKKLPQFNERQKLQISEKLIPILKNGRHYGASDAAARTLAAIGQPAIPPLMELLRSKSDKYTERVVWIISRMDKVSAPEAVPYFMLLLQQKSPHARSDAMLALGQLCNGNEEIMKVLISEFNKMTDQDEWNFSSKSKVIEALGGCGRAETAPMTVFMRALRDKSVYTRRNAAVALALLGPQAADALPALVKMKQESQGAEAQLWKFNPRELQEIDEAIRVLSSSGSLKAQPCLRWLNQYCFKVR